MGVRFSDYYNLGLLNIFVEGKSDREVFQWLLNIVKPHEDGRFSWRYVRASEFLDFTGVAGMEGFMKATYEFICDERPVVTILDGDAAGDKTRRALQQYLGNKNIPFDANKDFVSLHAGFALEGLFPHNWIIDAYNEHPGWFKEYSVDVEGRLLPFDLKSNQTKHQLRNHLISKSEADKSMSWIAKFEQVFDVVEKALHNQYIKVYGGEM